MAGPGGTYDAYLASSPSSSSLPTFGNVQQQPSSAGDGDNGVLSSVVSGAFGILGDFLNSRYAEKAATKQYERQMDFWNKQNDYNSPAAQRGRLEAAGINPAAAMSGGVENQSQNLSQVPGNAYAQMGAFSRASSALGNMGVAMLDYKLKQAQIKDIEASALLKESQAGESGERTTSLRIDNALKQALDDMEFTVPGLGQYRGARLVSAFSRASSALIQSYDDSIGYRSRLNTFESRQSFDWWNRATNYDLSLKEIQVKLGQSQLDLSQKEIEHLSKKIADLSSQIGYRTLMASISEQQLYELKRHNWTVENETKFHNEATERNDYNRVLVEAYKAQGSMQSALINALINGSPSIMPE